MSDKNSSVTQAMDVDSGETRPWCNRLAELRRLLTTRLNESELRTLCFDLDVDFDNLGSGGKIGKARELVAYAERHDHLPQLARLVSRLRPDVPWGDLIEGTGVPLGRSVSTERVRGQIPAEVAREILLESGHRCAVCGAGVHLEVAHIVPWRESMEHNAEDLVCLCANCHARAEREQWGKDTLLEYKRRPWVLRHYERERLPPESRMAQVKIKIAIELTDSDPRWLQQAIASYLGISPDTVEIVAVERG